MSSAADSILDQLLDGPPTFQVGVAPTADLPTTGARPPRIRYSHEAMAEYILANPWVTQDQIAAHFGYSASWISTIICSDAFQALLAKRRDELIDPTLKATIEDQLKGILARSLEILRVKLDKPAESVPDQLALQAAKVAAQAAGYGAKTREQAVPPVEMHLHLEAMKGNLVGLLQKQRQVTTIDVLGETQEEEASAGL